MIDIYLSQCTYSKTGRECKSSDECKHVGSHNGKRTALEGSGVRPGIISDEAGILGRHPVMGHAPQKRC